MTEDNKFVWGSGDVRVFKSMAEYELFVLWQEQKRVEQILIKAGVDPDDPEATLGNLDEEE